jgi:hemin uptake protein HemP
MADGSFSQGAISKNILHDYCVFFAIAVRLSLSHRCLLILSLNFRLSQLPYANAWQPMALATMTEALPPKNSDPADPHDDNVGGNREALRIVRSEDLFAGERVVLIQHGGEQYRLLVTRNDRLILQK